MEQTFSYSSQLCQIAFSAIAIFFRDFHDITIRHGRPRGVYASGKFPTIVEISEVAHNGGTLKPFAAYSIKIKLSVSPPKLFLLVLSCWGKLGNASRP